MSGTYSDRLSEGVKRPGRTRKGLADAMGISRQAVSQLLSGQSKSATAANNAAAARYLGCDPDWLATGEGAAGWEASGGPEPAPGLEEIVAREPVAHYNPRTIATLVRELGEKLREVDSLTRSAIGPLLKDLAERPSDGDRVAMLIDALVTASGKQRAA